MALGKIWRAFFWLLAGVSLSSSLAWAQANPIEELLGRRHLVVGTRVAPPFAMKDVSGDWYGFSIDIWRDIARDLDVSYELKELPLDELLTSLAEERIDLAVGALTVTAERELTMDFTHSFYQASLALAVPATQHSPWLATLFGFFSLQFLQVVFGLLTILFLVGAIVWWFERRENPEQFGGDAASGLGNGLWWSAVTMTTVGYGDRAPVSLGGRIVALVWMFASIIIISGITASITASLTVHNLSSGIQSIDDLRRLPVATIRGSISESYLQAERIGELRYYDSVELGLEAILSGEVKAMVYDTPILAFWLGQNPYQRELSLIRTMESPQLLAFAVPEKSRLREYIDRSMLNFMHGPIWQDRLRMYGLGSR